MWTRSKVNSIKLEIKSFLETKIDPNARIPKLLELIDTYQQSIDSDDRLRCAIGIISALYQHIRFGGLTDNQIKRLKQLFLGILQLENITPQKSKVSFLYGEFHTALSQIYRKNGKHWKAAWEEQTAEKASALESAVGRGFMHLSMGVRSLRLGHARLAWNEFQFAENCGLKGRSFNICRIEKVMVLKLLQKFEEAISLIDETLLHPECAPEFKTELVWERNVILAYQTKDLSDLVKIVRRGGTHNNYSYLTDVFFLTRIIPNTKWLDLYPSMKSMAYNPKLKPDKNKFTFRFCKVLESCYDTEIPLNFRLNILGDALSNADECLSIVHEMYVWLAATRWLARSHGFRQAALCLSEYESISMKVTQGTLRDCLGLAENLLEKDWYQEFQFPRLSG